MRKPILEDYRFNGPSPGWELPGPGDPRCQVTSRGCILSGKALIHGKGVHTRNGDTVELYFRPLERSQGAIIFDLGGGFEAVKVKLDLVTKRVFFATKDCTRPGTTADVSAVLRGRKDHLLLIAKTQGSGFLVKKADVSVFLNGRQVILEKDLNVLPEMAVTIGVENQKVLLSRFVHRSLPSGIPKYLRLGGWQMPNLPSIEKNLRSIFRGLEQAASASVQLLVTPETSLTGLFPDKRVTKDRRAIHEAERKLRNFIRRLKNAPYLIAGLPEWRQVPTRRRRSIRYNVSRLYDPDGNIVLSCPKIHSCENDFGHGYRLNEFDIYGVPACMHICHDGRYPDVWTLPVMFGARLVVHPANGGGGANSIAAFESLARQWTFTSHAFYIQVNGSGPSGIVDPRGVLLAASSDCRRDAATFPALDSPCESFFHARIHVPEAFGHWPVRSFRVSEDVAAAYVALYKAMGGQRCPGN